MGVALYYTRDEIVRSQIREIQNDLFVIGMILASFQNGSPAKAKLSEGAVARLEKASDDMERRTPKLKEFIIPGGCEGAVHLHVARAIARRTERSIFSSDQAACDKKGREQLHCQAVIISVRRGRLPELRRGNKGDPP